MKPFVGYTRRPEPKWPYLIIIAMVISILFVLIIIGNLLVSFRYSEPTKKVTTTSSIHLVTPTTMVEKTNAVTNGIKVEKIFFTSQVDSGNQPVDTINKAVLGRVSRLYCYTKIISHPPQTIRHVWLRPDGKLAGEVTLYITNNPAYTWSYVGLGEPQVGRYKVLVKDKSGRVIAEQSIELTPSVPLSY